tara:strand:+ start:1538 stop:2413 length:876 start_codon:yes stop_codon:yes gene_type:complete
MSDVLFSGTVRIFQGRQMNMKLGDAVSKAEKMGFSNKTIIECLDFDGSNIQKTNLILDKIDYATNAFRQIYDNNDLLELIALNTIDLNEEEDYINIYSHLRKFITAYPKLLKSVKICQYLTKHKTWDTISEYIMFLLNRNPITEDVLFKLVYGKDLSIPKTQFYDTQTVYVIYNMFRSYGIDIVKKIIENFDSLIKQIDRYLDKNNYNHYNNWNKKLGSVNRLKYCDLINRLYYLKMFENFTNFTFTAFIIDLRSDLLNVGVNLFLCEKILRRIIKSFNWMLECNNLDYHK